MTQEGWRDQWEFVGRKLDRLRVVYHDRTTKNSYEARDTLKEFFQAAHHMRDWVANDPASGIAASEVKALISTSPTLSITGDLANGSKHLQLNSAWTGDKSTRVTKSDAVVHIGEGSSHRFYVESSGKEHDALDLAEATVQEWENFLKLKGLLP